MVIAEGPRVTLIFEQESTAAPSYATDVPTFLLHYVHPEQFILDLQFYV